jgi:RNA polymerase sigma-70 factor (ECF subfamily)
LQFQPFTSDYVERLTRGDREIERHFTDYFSELLRIKLRKGLRSSESVEDVRQETFLRVFAALRNGRGLTNPGKLGAFVYGVCNNVLSEHYRAVSRHAHLPEKGIDPQESGPDPEAEFVNEERKRCVRDILDKLPAKDREILRLVFFEEREKLEVCRICKVDRNYLRVLLHRAKNRFREGLPKPGSPKGDGVKPDRIKQSLAASVGVGLMQPSRTASK